MNYVDLAILILVIISLGEGIRKGGAVQLFSYGGLAVGLVIGATLASPAAKLVADPIGRTVVSTVVLFGSAMLMGTVGRMLGARLAANFMRGILKPADAAAGAGVSIISTLLVVWLMAGMLASVPLEKVSQGIQGSKVIHALNESLPPTPGVFSRIRHVLNAAGLPQVFAGLEPAPAAEVPLPTDSQLRSAVAAAGPSTLKIVGVGCGGTLNGTGFVVAPGYVMTNAHVVAGINSPTVQDRRGGFHKAIPVIFDPSTDVAVLRAKGITAPPLKMHLQEAPRGQSAAVLGFPGGGPFKVVPAAVIDQIDAVGRDIYGRKLATRRVYRLKAEVRPGNSGGPLVNSSGEVEGVIFSASAVKPDIGYALTAKQVSPRIAEARSVAGEVDTGECAE
ncbi:MAG: MarP family serine protease [Actinomycetota bacterium]